MDRSPLTKYALKHSHQKKFLVFILPDYRQEVNYFSSKLAVFLADKIGYRNLT